MTAPAVLQPPPAHHVAGLSFDAERLAQRRLTLGASEIGAVAGLNRHRSPLDVWAEKRGIAPPFAGNEFTEWGLRLEGVIAEKYAEVVGCAFEQPQTIVRAEDPWMSCTPDRIAIREDGSRHGLEIKRFNEHRAAEFGPAGTDQVPDEVAAQCHWSMMVEGHVTTWDVAVLLGQADFRIYHLRYDDEIANHLYQIGRRFWHEYVLTGVEPEIDGTTASHHYLAQRFATHTQAMRTPTVEQVEMARRLVELRAVRAEIEHEESAIEANLKLAIGDAAGLDGLCTWKAPKTGPISWKSVAESLGAPRELIAQHTGTPSRRFLLTMKA